MTGEFLSSTFESLIQADMYIVIAAVYGICFALRRARFFDDRFIPLAALILGVGLQMLSAVAGGACISDSVLKGIICGMAAVFAANVIKQAGKKKDSGEDSKDDSESA